MTRHRPAPSARRTASSRCRVDDRARNRLVRFAQAISSTRPTAPSRMKAAGRTSRSSAAAHGVAVSCQFSYSANCAFSDCSTRRATVASSAFACASVAPGASRASTLNWRTFRGTCSGSPPHGSHRSVPMTTRPGGITPTIETARPLTRIGRSRMPGSPPNRDCQRRWLMIATGGPSGASSSRVNPRPSAGAQADHREQIVEQQRREHALGRVAADDVAVAEIEGRRVSEAA